MSAAVRPRGTSNGLIVPKFAAPTIEDGGLIELSGLFCRGSQRIGCCLAAYSSANCARASVKIAAIRNERTLWIVPYVTIVSILPLFPPMSAVWTVPRAPSRWPTAHNSKNPELKTNSMRMRIVMCSSFASHQGGAANERASCSDQKGRAPCEQLYLP